MGKSIAEFVGERSALRTANAVRKLMKVLAIGAFIWCANKLVAQQPAPASSYAWTCETWTGSNYVYAAARRNVEQEISRASNIDAVVFKYKLLCHLQPRNALAAFKWSIAAFDAQAKTLEESQVEKYSDGVSSALASVPSPAVYEFTRMRFLFQVLSSNSDIKLISVGKRLLAFEGNDPAVLRAAAWNNAGKPSEYRELIRRAIALAPTEPANYFRLGELDDCEYLSTGKTEYARETKEAFATFLKMTSGTNDARQEATDMVRDMTAALNKPQMTSPRKTEGEPTLIGSRPNP